MSGLLRFSPWVLTNQILVFLSAVLLFAESPYAFERCFYFVGIQKFA